MLRMGAPAAEEAVLVGQRELVGGDEHHGVLGESAQELLHRDEGAERIAVGVLVGDEEELLVGADLVDDLGARALSHHAHASSSSSSSLMRMPVSMDGS